MIQKCKTRHSR